MHSASIKYCHNGGMSICNCLQNPRYLKQKVTKHITIISMLEACFGPKQIQCCSPIEPTTYIHGRYEAGADMTLEVCSLVLKVRIPNLQLSVKQCRDFISVPRGNPCHPDQEEKKCWPMGTHHSGKPAGLHL